MVRVANILKQYQTETDTLGPDRMTPARQLTEIRRKTLGMLKVATDHWLKKLQPALAEAGTIRGDFGLDVTENLIHASDSPEAAEREIGLFFD